MPDSSSSSFKAFASTGPGLESIAAGELKALGVRGQQEIGGVAFSADLQRLYAANLWLRTATRVLVRLGSFHASTFYELERRAKKLPWAEFLPASGKVRLRVTCRKSKLYHSDAVGERVLSAIVGSASRVIEGSADETDPSETEDAGNADPSETLDASDSEIRSMRESGQLFIVRIVNDECEVSADSSGELLHKRGYRKEIAKAPLRETIAAAMVLASGWKGNEPLLDPLCGSGTIPIEAALIARKIAPGLRRNFQFMDWPDFDAELWNRVLEEARAAVTVFSGEILGSDRDAGAVHAAARNAERAGVSENVLFSPGAVSGSIAAIGDSVRESGWILTNPPYGVRVGESDDLRNLYAKLGSALRSKPGWRLGVLTSDSALVRQTKLSLRPRFSTSNGGIPVSYFVSEKTSKAEAQLLDYNRTGVLVSINASGGGVPKRRVGAARVSRLGLLGDTHNDKIHHGGPERAVCVYSLERIHALQQEGHPIDVGTAGENVTLEGIDWDLIVPGVRIKLGQEVVLEVASFTSPCKTIKESFIDGRFVRISQKLHPGWSRVYARVLTEGEIRFGDHVEVIPAT